MGFVIIHIEVIVRMIASLNGN